MERDEQDIPNAEWEQLTSTRAWFLGLAKEMGMPAALLGQLMGSREYTEHIALSLIDAARHQRADNDRLD